MSAQQPTGWQDFPPLDFEELPRLDFPPVQPFTEADYDHMRERYRPSHRTQATEGRGRKAPNLNSPQVQHLLAALEGGAFVQTAALAAGLSERTVHRWIEKGKAEELEGTQGVYWQLWQAIAAARFIAENRALGTIWQAAERGTWRAAAWWLERAYPEKWSLRRTKGLHGDRGREAAHMDPQPQVTAEDLEAKVQALLAVIPQKDPD